MCIRDRSVGAISYAVSSSDSEVTVSEIETADSFRAATTNVTTNGVSMLSWSDSNGVAGDSNVIGTYTATVNGDIVDGTESVSYTHLVLIVCCCDGNILGGNNNNNNNNHCCPPPCDPCDPCDPCC